MCSEPGSRANWHGERRGAALFLAIVALAAIGAMVSGTFFIGWLEQRAATASRAGAEAFEAAEAGAAETISAWAPALNRLPVGADTVVGSRAVSSRASFSVDVRRLSPAVFMLRSEGISQAIGSGGPGTGSRRLLAMFARLIPPDIDRGSALTLGGLGTVADSSVVDGSSHVPTGWNALCPAGAAVPAIRTPGSAVLADSGPPPAVATDSSIGPATFTTFGSTTFDELASGADRQVGGAIGPIGPATAAGRCTDAQSNWGEPSTGGVSVPECFDVMPTVYASGNLALAGGRGQGLLLVRGDLDLSGGVEFTGVVIVLGRVTTGVGGGHVLGTLLVAGDSGASTLGAGSSIRYSGCAISRALLGSGRPRPLAGRGWAQLY